MPVPRRRVHVVWWTAAAIDGNGTETRMAVYEPNASAEDAALSVFPVGTALVGDGEQAATLLGEAGLNAACGVELADDSIVWPTYNPEVARWAPKPGAPALRAQTEPGFHDTTPSWHTKALLAALLVATLGAWVARRAGAPEEIAAIGFRVAVVIGAVTAPLLAVRWRLRSGR